MFVNYQYQILLDRFFILARMEKLATTKLGWANEMQGDDNLVISLNEELRKLHDEKLQLLVSLQEFMLAGNNAFEFASVAHQ